ncbi:hypothetical protein AO373_0876 [Moraxella catarrhalis]|nr:hypothetical protein AO373_0876 [Moraxella catarrhalis]
MQGKALKYYQQLHDRTGRLEKAVSLLKATLLSSRPHRSLRNDNGLKLAVMKPSRPHRSLRK